MKSGSSVLNTHVACGAAYMISCTDPRFFEEPEMITPDGTSINIAERFLDSILAKTKRLREMLKYIMPIEWTIEEKAAFENTECIHTCHICKEEIKPAEKQVPDHDLLTGKYRGPAHNKCNLDYGFKAKSVQIPCFSII